MGGSDLLTVVIAATVWWIPTILVARDMDRIPGLPRLFFWAPLPIVGLPVIGPVLYWTLFRRRFVALGERTLQHRDDLDRARRARGAGTEGGPRPSGGKRRRRR